MSEPLGAVISRLIREASGFNTLNELTVDVYFQKSPGNDAGDQRGIENLDYRLERNGRVLQQGRTGPDGKIEVPVRGNTPTVLKLLHGSVEQAVYEVSVRAGALGLLTNLTGQKQRLRLLGYHIGHSGIDGDGVDNINAMAFERSVLDFQADHGLPDNANTADNNCTNRLRTEAGA